MVRYVAVLRRRPDVTREVFLASWLGEHLSLARQLPHVADVQFLPTCEEAGGDDAPDGVGFLDFPDLGSLEESLASEQARALRAHTATFADSAAAVRVIVEVPE
jgi:hypothetical protein